MHLERQTGRKVEDAERQIDEERALARNQMIQEEERARQRLELERKERARKELEWRRARSAEDATKTALEDF